MSMKPYVSIAMATFNGASYVQQQLESFSKQTVLPDEVIVSDDGSTDSTVPLIRQFAINAPFSIRVLENSSTVGYAQNFSRVLTECRGDIVFLSDQDDYWLPAKIERILRQFGENKNVQLVFHDLEYCRDDLSTIGQTKLARMRGVFDLEKEYVVGMATALRGEFLRLCLPVPCAPNIAHDNWLHDCARLTGGKLILDEVLALYRRHTANVTRGSNLNSAVVLEKKDFEVALSQKICRRSRGLSGVEREEFLADWIKRSQFPLVESGIVSEEVVQSLIASQSKVAEARRRRFLLQQAPRWRRSAPVLRLYLSGGYACFSGWKSALKDLLVQ